ncbi:MAG: hypothetical protein WDO15_17975 [Bacteroidota bacterium]
MNWQDVAKQLNDCNKTIATAITKLSSEPNYTKALAVRAEGIVKGQQKALRSVFEFYDGYDPQFTWWVTKPFQKLDTTLVKYADLLKKKVDPATLPKDDGSGIIGNPIGREELIRQLQFEMIPYSPEDLIDIANKGIRMV